MDYSIVNQTLDICTAIVTEIHRQYPEFEVDMAIRESSQSRGEFAIYVSDGYKQGPLIRPRISIVLLEYEAGKISSEIMAELEIHDHDQPDPSLFSADAILKLCTHLEPLVAETLIHRPPDMILEPGVTKRVINRVINVKFRVLDEFFQENEDHSFNIDEKKIARQAVPYIKTLVDIHSKIYSWKDALR